MIIRIIGLMMAETDG